MEQYEKINFMVCLMLDEFCPIVEIDRAGIILQARETEDKELKEKLYLKAGGLRTMVRIARALISDYYDEHPENKPIKLGCK